MARLSDMPSYTTDALTTGPTVGYAPTPAPSQGTMLLITPSRTHFLSCRNRLAATDYGKPLMAFEYRAYPYINLSENEGLLVDEQKPQKCPSHSGSVAFT